MVLDLPRLFRSPKKLVSDLMWVETENELSFLAPVEVDGITMEGIRLRGTAYPSVPQRSVMLQIECHSARYKVGPLDRMDWNPLHEHNNKRKGPPELIFLRQRVSHHHTFDWNWLEEEKRMRAGNLPIAVPMAEIASVEELFKFAEDYYLIKGLSKQRLPEWQGDLFRSLP